MIPTLEFSRQNKLTSLKETGGDAGVSNINRKLSKLFKLFFCRSQAHVSKEKEKEDNGESCNMIYVYLLAII
jgi:hypothetical protein